MTDEEIEVARKKIHDLDHEQEIAEAIKLSEQLHSFFRQTLRTYYNCSMQENEWLSDESLSQVCEQSVKSLSDFRHRYPHTITAFKFLSIVVFWIIKIKPVNGLALKKDDKHLDWPDVNEQLALKYIQYAICRMLEKDKVPEFLVSNQQTKDMTHQIFKILFEHELYQHKDQDEKIKDSYRNNKIYETAYYMRFKKMTAINIYESLTHLFLPISCGFITNKDV